VPPVAKRAVTTPSGDAWRVRRLWAPRLQGETLWARAWRRMRRVGRRTGEATTDVPDPGCLGDLGEELAILLAVVVVVLFVLFVAIPFLVVLLDVLLLAVLTAAGLVGRLLFRRPWVVEARGPDGMRRTWRIVGWRASHEAVDFVADALAHGHPPPPGHELSSLPGDDSRAAPPSGDAA
jgi:hypothetical protein